MFSKLFDLTVEVGRLIVLDCERVVEYRHGIVCDDETDVLPIGVALP